jgi:hypothetical protein
MSGMLKRRPGDDQRQRANARRLVRAFVEDRLGPVPFCAADVSRFTGVAFNTAASQLDQLVDKGVIVAVDKPGDPRRHFQRVRGAR